MTFDSFLDGPQVEKIAGKRIGKRGGAEYYIHWKGFDDSYNSWEPEENLIECDQLIAQFNAKHNVSSFSEKMFMTQH